MSVVAAISPNTATLYQQAQLGPLLANQDLVPNPVARPLPSFPDISNSGDRRPRLLGAQPVDTGQPAGLPNPIRSAGDDINTALTNNSVLPSGSNCPQQRTSHSARLTLDLSASITAWLKSLAYVLLFILTLLLVDSRQRLKTLAYILVLSGLGQAVYGSLALAVAGGGVATGTFVNRNHFAAYLVLCLAVGIGLLIASMGRSAGAGSWRQRLRHIGALILSAKAPLRIFLAIMVIALVLTRSRMGNTAFFASLLITGSLALILFKDMPRPDDAADRQPDRDRHHHHRQLGRHRAGEGTHRADYPGTGDHATSSTSTAANCGRTTRFSAPGRGVTTASFRATGKGMRVRVSWSTPTTTTSNSSPNTASSAGLFPAGVVILALRNAILAQRKRRSQFARGIGFAATMAITAMLIHATVEFNLQIPAYAATFMVILAMAWLSRYLRSENQSRPRSN